MLGMAVLVEKAVIGIQGGAAAFACAIGVHAHDDLRGKTSSYARILTIKAVFWFSSLAGEASVGELCSHHQGSCLALCGIRAVRLHVQCLHIVQAEFDVAADIAVERGAGIAFFSARDV